MKRAMVVVMLLGLTTQANADERDSWQAVFAGSLTVALGGVITYWHGQSKVAEAEDSLCAGGAYFDCRATARVPLTQEEVDRLNDKGDRGETIANVGLAVAAIGVVGAGVGLYKGFLVKEHAVVVTPAVSQQGAGAVLSLRW
jgi:hypothetical protein